MTSWADWRADAELAWHQAAENGLRGAVIRAHVGDARHGEVSLGASRQAGTGWEWGELEAELERWGRDRRDQALARYEQLVGEILLEIARDQRQFLDWGSL